MDHRLVWVGKLQKREPESLLCERYVARIRSFTKLDWHLLKPNQDRWLSTASIQQKEATKILGAIEPRDFVVLCDEHGRELRSPELALHFAKWQECGNRRLVWVVGGAMGVSEQVKERANFVLALSKMTLPHALARVILVEQIYRAFCIQAGHPYHHEG